MYTAIEESVWLDNEKFATFHGYSQDQAELRAEMFARLMNMALEKVQ